MADESHHPPAVPRRKRRFWQFSLRTLMIGVTVSAVFCGWIGRKAEQARQQRIAVEALKRLGATVIYDYQTVQYAEAGDWISAVNVDVTTPPGVVTGPQWLRSVVGDDLFCNVIEIDQIFRAPGARFHFTPIGDDDKTNIDEILMRLPHLRCLVIDSIRVSASMQERLSSFPNLEKLWIHSPLTPAGRREISSLSKLRFLRLDDESLGDADLVAFSGLQQLELLDLHNDLVTLDGVKQLQKKLPNAKVWRTTETDTQ